MKCHFYNLHENKLSVACHAELFGNISNVQESSGSLTLLKTSESSVVWKTVEMIVFIKMFCVCHTHRSAWLFLKNKFKWKNPESMQARRSRGRVTEEEEPEMFGEDAIPRPPGAHRKSKVQRSSSSTSDTSGSQKEQFTELMQTQINLDREAKKEHMERELAARLAVCEIQKRNEELKILTFDTTGMNPADTAKIEALKDAARAKYFNF
nr:hypothetical protein [Tanacetum cinerariifolium]